MTATRATVATLAVLMTAGPSFAADAPAGAASCSGCHATSTKIESPVPRVLGKPQAEITAAMIEFKSGARPGTIMDRIAKGFSEEEIRAIAKWYESQGK